MGFYSRYCGLWKTFLKIFPLLSFAGHLSG
jgi:hypothetical protein